MLNRKTKRPKKEEGEENGLLQSDTVLEYQNKCLSTLVGELREKLKSKEESFNNLSFQFNSTISFLNTFTSTINSLNDEITKALTKSKISFDSIKEENLDKKKIIYSSLSQFIQDLLSKKEPKEEKIQHNKQSSHHSNSKMSLNNVDDEEIKEAENLANEKEKEKEKEKQYEPLINLSKNLDILLNNLIPVLLLNDDKYKKLFSNIDDEIVNKNKELEETLEELNNNLTNYKTNLEKIKSENILNKSKISDLEEKVENLTQDKFRLNRKLNTFPSMPLLVVEGYTKGKPVEEHDCICVVCGKNMNENQNANNATNNETKDENKIKEEEKKENEMKIEENIKTNEDMEELVKENEALKKRIQELHENLEDVQGKTEITEENILNSKHFQSLIAQAENILTKLEKMKEINNNLQKENNNLNQKKENEILQISNSFNEQLEKSSQKLLEMAKTIEKNKTTIQLLMNKIESNENLLKEKDTFNINIFYESFKKERENLIHKIDFLETQKKDYINKYEDESLKNQTNQLNISLLRNEINNLKIIMNSNKNEDKKMLQYELNKEAIKNDQEKVEIYKKEIERLKNEIIKERKNYQNLSELNDMSQKNITELNTTIKNLKNKIDELNQNFAKVLNEKTESKQTISYLTEMKEVLEKKNEAFKEQLDNYSIYMKKMEDEFEMQKKLNNSLEEAKKLNEKDIEILKSKNIENLKNIDKEKMMKEDLQNKFNELKNAKKKMGIDYDILKVKYDDLCKAKQFDPNSIDVGNISKENEVLKLENQKFREMVHCKVCKTEIKDVVITKCFHTFCKKCIDAAIESRKRRCPICRELISQNDVKKIFWD